MATDEACNRLKEALQLNRCKVDITHVALIRRAIFEVTFSDGCVKRVDMKPHLWGEKFEELKRIGVLRQYSVTNGTLCWPKLNIEMNPMFLYEHGKDIHQDDSE